MTTRAEQALALYKRGLTVTQVGKQMGLRRDTVHHYICKANLEEFQRIRDERKQKRVDYVISLVERGFSFSEVRLRLKVAPKTLARVYTSHRALIRRIREDVLHKKRERAWAYYLKSGTIRETAIYFGVNKLTIVRWFHKLHGANYRSRAASASIIKVANEYLNDKHLPPHKLREIREWVSNLDADPLTRDVQRAVERPTINERLIEDYEARITPLLGRMVVHY